MSDQIDVNALADALNEKMDLPDGKSQSGVDFVIDWKVPTSSDPSWYRVYKSGWVEQGGHSTTGTNPRTVTLSKTMANTNYTITYGDDNRFVGTLTQSRMVKTYTKTTTGFTTTGIYQNASSTDYEFDWEVKGMGA